MATQSLSEPTPPSDEGSVPFEPTRGTRLGRYELLVPIASGGMGKVWIAHQTGDLGFRRLVALKTIRGEFAENIAFRRMFLDEAQLAARIRHTNVVEVLDLGEEGPILFQAMTLIEGDSLAGLLQKRRTRDSRGLPPNIMVRIMADAMAGLHAAHELTAEDGTPMKLVHRDVSPQNILVGIDGVTKIADFGIAKALGRLSDETEAGQVKGKFSYLAPEQIARKPPDRRSDVFAAGIVLWEMLTGERLFRGVDVIETLAKVATLEVPDPRTYVADISAPVALATMKALERDANKRYPTAAEFGDALEAAARASNAPMASTKEVGAFVYGLVRKDVERRRARIRDEGARSALEDVDSDPPPPPSSRHPAATEAMPTMVDRGTPEPVQSTIAAEQPVSSRRLPRAKRTLVAFAGIATLLGTLGVLAVMASPRAEPQSARPFAPSPETPIANSAADDPSARASLPTVSPSASASASPSAAPASDAPTASVPGIAKTSATHVPSAGATVRRVPKTSGSKPATAAGAGPKYDKL